MKKSLFKKVVITIASLVILYWLPFIIITLRNSSSVVTDIEKLPHSDAVVIFGTLVNESGEISPLLRERLDAGIAILDAGKSDKIIVSNTEDAANAMAQYLYDNNVPTGSVEIDTQANRTPDTCKYEKAKHPEQRELIFVSQGYHLPRLLYQCNKVGIEGVAFPAEALNIIDRSEYSLLTKITVRSKRYTREAGLTWLAFLNIYR